MFFFGIKSWESARLFASHRHLDSDFAFSLSFGHLHSLFGLRPVLSSVTHSLHSFEGSQAFRSLFLLLRPQKPT